MRNIYLANISRTYQQTDAYIYKELASRGYVVKKTLWGRDNTRVVRFRKLKEMLKLLSNALYLATHAHRHDIIFIWDSQLQAARYSLIFRIIRRDLRVVAYNCMDDIRRIRDKPFKRWIDRKVYKQIICTFSSKEQADVYKQILKLPDWHFHVVKDSLKNHPSTLDTITDRSDKGYIFSGGGTGRDWEMLKNVAAELPQYVFKVATNARNVALLADAPKNVEVYQLRYKDFNQLAANSSLCFMPLLSSWQGGVTVINDAAYLGKFSVTTDFLGLNGYYEKGEIVVVPRGDYKSAAKKIDHLMKDENLRKEMASKAQARVNNYTFANFWKKFEEEIFPLI